MIHVYIQGGAEPDAHAGYEINVSKDSVAGFKQLVFRAVNLWPDAPAEIKQFADMITEGKPMQNYIAHPHLSGKAKPTTT